MPYEFHRETFPVPKDCTSLPSLDRKVENFLAKMAREDWERVAVLTTVSWVTYEFRRPIQKGPRPTKSTTEDVTRSVFADADRESSEAIPGFAAANHGGWDS